MRTEHQGRFAHRNNEKPTLQQLAEKARQPIPQRPRFARNIPDLLQQVGLNVEEGGKVADICTLYVYRVAKLQHQNVRKSETAIEKALRKEFVSLRDGVGAESSVVREKLDEQGFFREAISALHKYARNNWHSIVNDPFNHNAVNTSRNSDSRLR